MSEQVNNLLNKGYNPDVLECLANLSNDEVFTPPKVVNNMLDMFPEEIWSNPDLTFLDPACKTGVFLREIAKRLIVGLEEKIPDLQERLDHIFHKQLYGIAITELTALASRRSLYCSKYADGKYSVSKFNNPNGNIRFVSMNHAWVNGKCKYCGASAEQYQRASELETHAYEFIHTNNPEEIFGMKFDVIIGNPPYQLSTGGAQAQATPIYNKFVDQARKLRPKYLCMITPSRWFTGGFGLDSFRKTMLEDDSLRIIHDYLDASVCFPGVEIKGGVCYFLWKRDDKGKCMVNTYRGELLSSSMERDLLEDGLDFFIRYNEAVPIFKKVKIFNEKSLTEIISSQRPFGLPTNFDGFIKDKDETHSIKIYANKKVGYAPLSVITKNSGLIPKYKVLTPKAIGSGDSRTDWVKPILAEPGSACTETYIILGAFDSREEAENLISYTQTKFFHFMLTLKKNTQDALSKAYVAVPLQDFSESWADDKLYKKYNLSPDEVSFINDIITPAEDR